MSRDAKGRGVTGRVLLVGAGPGDPDLITVRGASALASADVVLYDELSSEELLTIAPERAERINVGKRGHDLPSRSQEEIQKIIVERALAGDTIVRLKGGDPFVFGRGGEEASACAEAGIPCEIVPGVSSTIGALAYAGIPVTDRRYAASFAVVTGHKDPSEATEGTRWAELGRAVDTLVILMGMKQLEGILERIMDGGRDAATPSAAVMNGTLATQRVVEAPLGELAARVREAGLGAPSVVVVGDVVRLRQQLQWWEKKPLFGKRVVITRTSAQAGEMASALRSAGAEPVLLPMIRLVEPEDTREFDAALDRIDDYDGLLFTSANAVRFFVARARERGLGDRFSELSARILCVGPQSARAALEAGFLVHLTGTGRGDAEAFLGELIQLLPPAGRRFLLPRSDVGGDVVRHGLQEAGAEVDAVVAYRNLPAPVDADALNRELVSGGFDVLTFASPSAVHNFFSLLGSEAREAVKGTIVAAVGRTTGKALREEGVAADVIPARPGGADLVAALVESVSSRLGD